jgi:CsoR family transcriptional regulator, copper-sensing transcriptional repressor
MSDLRDVRSDEGEPRGAESRRAHCHVPASFDPQRHEQLLASIHRLVGAASWLEREVAEGRECHALLSQVAVLESELRSISVSVLDGHLSACLLGAIAQGQRPEEIATLLAPIRSVLYRR